MVERATGSPAISVRRMHDGEERDVRALAGRVYSRPESAFFSPPPQTLVAERDGHLVGAVVPKVFALPDKRCCGAIFWLMTSPQARGLGVGGRLVGAACEYFEEHGCQEAFACVEGYNTSSSNLFAARGFTILSPGEQLRRYGLSGTFALWIKMSRLGADVGHYLWACPGATRPDYPRLQWWAGTVFLSVLVFLLAGWRGAWMDRDAVWPARSSDEAGGVLAGVGGAAPRLGGGPPLERWRCSVTRLVLSNSRLRLSSEPRVALPKPTSQAWPDRLYRGIGRAALRVGHVGAAAVWRASTRDCLLASLGPRGGADASALRRAAALLYFRLVQRAANLGLESAGVGGAGRRDGRIVLGKRMSKR